MYGQKKNFSTFSYKLVQISPIMILVNSGAFLSISSWFCELTELIFVMIPYISSTSYPPKTQGIMGHVQVANRTPRFKCTYRGELTYKIFKRTATEEWMNLTIGHYRLAFCLCVKSSLRAKPFIRFAQRRAITLKCQLSNLFMVANSHYQFNSADKTKLSCNTPQRRSTTVSLETYPLYSYENVFHLHGFFFSCKSNSFSYERFFAKTQFITEAQGTRKWPIARLLVAVDL